jgi:hypothetical protein
MEGNFEHTFFQQAAQWMLVSGYSFDFVSDRQLQNIPVIDKHLRSGGNYYKTILLPANKLIPGKSLEKLFQLAKQGARILFYKELPSGVPGYSMLAKNQDQVNGLMKQLSFLKTNIDPLLIANTGKGNFYLGNDLEALLKAAGARQESMVQKGLQFTRRINNDRTTYFITNLSEKPVDEWIPVNTIAGNGILFNPATGKAGLAKCRKTTVTKPGEVYLQLQPFESVILQMTSAKTTGIGYPYWQQAGEPQEIKGNWNIQFIEGGPVLPAATTVSQLGSWTELNSEGVNNFSGRVAYSIDFSVPLNKPPAFLLDLGQVNETAEVWLNGKRLGSLIGPSFRLEIPAGLLQLANHLKIIVSNLMANRIAYMDRNQVPWKIFYNTNMPARRRENVTNGLFDASSWKPLPSGLSGPVTLTPVKLK